mgnify:CR=1 FL=1|tara:strand:+ start:107 stop:289 length:183 start_codon:yes stop_codon:yes gene_type:complete
MKKCHREKLFVGSRKKIPWQRLPGFVILNVKKPLKKLGAFLFSYLGLKKHYSKKKSNEPK